MLSDKGFYVTERNLVYECFYCLFIYFYVCLWFFPLILSASKLFKFFFFFVCVFRYSLKKKILSMGSHAPSIRVYPPSFSEPLPFDSRPYESRANMVNFRLIWYKLGTLAGYNPLIRKYLRWLPTFFDQPKLTNSKKFSSFLRFR